MDGTLVETVMESGSAGDLMLSKTLMKAQHTSPMQGLAKPNSSQRFSESLNFDAEVTSAQKQQIIDEPLHEINFNILNDAAQPQDCDDLHVLEHSGSVSSPGEKKYTSGTRQAIS